MATTSRTVTPPEMASQPLKLRPSLANWLSNPWAVLLNGDAVASRHGKKRLARKVSALASSTNSGIRPLIGSQSTPPPGAQLGWTAVHRSEITIDLGAVRHNARRLFEALDGAELWAVVKANGYG